MTYEINRSAIPWTCFPEELDTHNFVDISPIGRPWAKFFDTETGKTHDCAKYYERAMDEMKEMNARHKGVWQ